MIQKFISIKNVGKIKSLTSTDDLNTTKSVLIFGENATGKTTLTSLFHSLKDGNQAILRGRKTLGSSEPIEVNIRMSDRNVIFKDDNWSAVINNIEVFDSKFISDNVFNGTYVDINNRRSLQVFAIGEESVGLSKDIFTLDESIRELQGENNEKERKIGSKIVGSLSVDSFIQLTKEEQVDEKITQKEKLISALKAAGKILVRQNLKELNYPVLEISKLKKLLELSIDSVSVEAEKKVNEHLAKYFESDGEDWLNKGVSHIEDDSCPFCEQSLVKVQIVEYYKQYFSEEYNNHKDQISSAIKDLLQEFNIQKLSNIRTTVELNSGLMNEWGEIISSSLVLPEIDYDVIIDTFEKLKSTVISTVKKKEMNPLEKLEVNDEIQKLVVDYESKCSVLDNYAKIVKSIKEDIEKKKSTLAKGNLAIEENQLQILVNQKNRYNKDIDELIVSFLKCQEKIEKLKEEKTDKKEELSRINENFILKYESSINKFLNKFNADFKIVDQKIAYPGGRPSLNYKLEINSRTIELGDESTTLDLPSFKNTLSEGDKHTLAFSFFLAKLDNDRNLGNKIVVVDDPVNSFDSNRRSVTATILRAMSQKALQLIILTHEPAFAFKVKDIFDKDIRCFRIIREGHNTTFKLFVPREEFRDDYLKHYFRLLEFQEKGMGDLDSIAESIRPLIEGNLKFRFPRVFDKENIWLGTMIKIVREGPDEPEILFLRKNHFETLSEICDYAKDFHHPDPGINAIIDTNELKGFVKRTLEFCST